MRKSMQLKAVAFAAAAALMGVSGMASASEAAQTAPSTFKPGTYTAQVNGHNAPLTVQVTVGKNRIKRSTTPRILRRSASAELRSTL